MLKNITLSAEESYIQKAREKALRSKKSLNEVFREWLLRYIKNNNQIMDYYTLMQQLQHVKAGKKFSRDELNER